MPENTSFLPKLPKKQRIQREVNNIYCCFSDIFRVKNLQACQTLEVFPSFDGDSPDKNIRLY